MTRVGPFVGRDWPNNKMQVFILDNCAWLTDNQWALSESLGDVCHNTVGR